MCWSIGSNKKSLGYKWDKGSRWWIKWKKKDELLQIFTSLTMWQYDSETKFLKCENVSYISGYTVWKLSENHNLNRCSFCYKHTVIERKDMNYNASLINEN